MKPPTIGYGTPRTRSRFTRLSARSNDDRESVAYVPNDQSPLPYHIAALGTLRCIVKTAELLARHRIHQPSTLVGMRLHFADGTSARVYRDTIVDRDPAPSDPCVLVVEFSLRAVRGWGHTLFRMESQLIVPLFVGYPGYVSKLWLANDQHGAYRGVYEWDGAERAEYYARCLWRVLALVSMPGSIHYHVLPGRRRDDLLASHQRAEPAAPEERREWWRVIAAA